MPRTVRCTSASFMLLAGSGVLGPKAPPLVSVSVALAIFGRVLLVL